MHRALEPATHLEVIMDLRLKMLETTDRDVAKSLFSLMAAVFEEECASLSDGYVDRLLANEALWVIAAFDGERLVGGLTAHTLAMARKEASEVFIYDIAVSERDQRQGVGRRLVSELLARAAAASIHDVFVAADNEDVHALDFYRALGGAGSAVTIFDFQTSLAGSPAR
jgi:aminoglycoside 3-N-acetyltransferase I